MTKLLRYFGIAALGFISVAAIGITLGASTMLACYLTTCGINHAQRSAIKELRAIDEESQQIRAQSPEKNEPETITIPAPEPAPSQNENPNDRRTWANNGSVREQTNVVIRPIEQYPAQ